MAKGRVGTRLSVTRIEDVPLREVSGVDKSASIARLSDLRIGDEVATATASWPLPDLDGKPEGLAFTRNGRAIVALDTKKARHNLLLFEPPIAAAAAS